MDSKQKIIDLEMSLGLLQRDYEKQNEVLLENAKKIQQLEMHVRRLIDQVNMLQAGSGGNERLYKNEKPPHY